MEIALAETRSTGSRSRYQHGPRAAGLAQPIRGHGVEQSVDAHHVRPIKRDGKRQISAARSVIGSSGRQRRSQSISRVATADFTLRPTIAASPSPPALARDGKKSVEWICSCHAAN